MKRAGPKEDNWEREPSPFRAEETLYIELTEEAAD